MVPLRKSLLRICIVQGLNSDEDDLERLLGDLNIGQFLMKLPPFSPHTYDLSDYILHNQLMVKRKNFFLSMIDEMKAEKLFSR